LKGQRQFMTTGDVARSCQVTTNAVKKWIREKDLPAFKTPGGHFRIRREDFEAFLRKYRMPLMEGAPASGPAKVLVAEDDADLRSLLVMALSDPELGLEVESASDGYEALIAIGRLKPRVLILDLRMPRLDGIEVCRRLKSDPPTRDIAIVVTSGFASVPNVRKLKLLGVEEILPKPYSLPDLVAVVQRALGRGPTTGDPPTRS
jgi:excisionase family DNA binding protein